MLASGISLQRLARIQGRSTRVLDETYSEQLAERIEPVPRIAAASAAIDCCSTSVLERS